jgi:transposase
VLYDMTNTHFEGLCEKNPKARHGKNKQKRDDCRQVAIGMAFDSRGLALAHDVSEGNIAETKTLAHMLDRLALPGTQAAKPVVYMILLAAEEGFACLKGSLGLRPNFHQLEHRVEALILISVLAYHLLTWVRETLRLSGDTRDWKTLHRLLSTHSPVTTVLPLKNRQVLRIPKPSVPDAEQKLIYDKLAIDWKAAFPAVKTFANP